MQLIIGGSAQGKLSYILRRDGLSPADVCDGAACALDAVPSARVLSRLHLLTRRLLKADMEPEAFVERFTRLNPEAVVVCDEIGCGIVPMSEIEREWRERTGRILCVLAARAERVERVYCGIPEMIKK